jgi:hypothetical protein
MDEEMKEFLAKAYPIDERDETINDFIEHFENTPFYENDLEDAAYQRGEFHGWMKAHTQRGFDLEKNKDSENV